MLDKYYSCIGKHLKLYRFQPYFADFIFQCYQNKEFISHYRFHQKKTNTVEELKKELLRIQSLPPQLVRSLEWVICEKETGKPVGLAGLVNYQEHHGNAELLIGLLPEAGSSYYAAGPEATLLVLEFAFHSIALHKLLSFVYGYNKKAQKSTLRLGFHQEGFLRQQLRVNQQEFIDLYQNGLLQSDFYNNKSLAKLSMHLLNRDITQPGSKKNDNILKSNLLDKILKQRSQNAVKKEFK